MKIVRAVLLEELIHKKYSQRERERVFSISSYICAHTRTFKIVDTIFSISFYVWANTCTSKIVRALPLEELFTENVLCVCV